MKNIIDFSDRELYLLCKQYGTRVLYARRRFAGLLPEVMRREMAAKDCGGSWLGRRGYTCIYEFAAKLAGMSREQVNIVLRMENRFRDKPVLKDALVKGKVSVNKLVRVASIATPDNQNDLFNIVNSLSQKAIEVYVNDYKSRIVDENRSLNQNISGCNTELIQKINNKEGLNKGLVNGKGMRAHSNREYVVQDVKLMLKLSEVLKNRLIEMDEKGLDINKILIELLDKRERDLYCKKRNIALEAEAEHSEKAFIGMNVSRYIPIKVRNLIKAEFGSKCAVKSCSRKSDHLHHTKYFSKWRIHDPRYLRPLCKGHHELEHAALPP